MNEVEQLTRQSTTESTVSERREPAESTPILPVTLVPTPTYEYRTMRKARRVTTATTPGAPASGPVGDPRIPVPIPPRLPNSTGSRVLIWKQDPSVSEIGVRKSYIPSRVYSGPRDPRITTQGVTPVSPNVFGDFVETPGTEAFDAVHTYAVVRQTLTLFQRALGTPAPLPWQWNSGSNTDPLKVFPRAGVTQNAYYSRSQRALKFFYFTRPGTADTVYTCRSFDIVAHETGHAVLDALKPGWLLGGNPPQTGALHEAFGDLTAIFLALSQLDQVEAIIAQTKANLHVKNFLSDVAEQFGLALGRQNGLRNADNDLRLSQVGNEVHDLSQIFTGAMYDILADVFRFERNAARYDDAARLNDVATYVMSLLLRSIVAAPASGATFTHVANNMLNFTLADGKPADYRTFIRNRFTLREVVVAAVPFAASVETDLPLEAAEHVSINPGPQNREACCGTMQLAEYLGDEDDERDLPRQFETFQKHLAGIVSEMVTTIPATSKAGNGKASRVK